MRCSRLIHTSRSCRRCARNSGVYCALTFSDDRKYLQRRHRTRWQRVRKAGMGTWCRLVSLLGRARGGGGRHAIDFGVHMWHQPRTTTHRARAKLPTS
jgi:hypothetical protein